MEIFNPLVFICLFSPHILSFSSALQNDDDQDAIQFCPQGQYVDTISKWPNLYLVCTHPRSGKTTKITSNQICNTGSWSSSQNCGGFRPDGETETIHGFTNGLQAQRDKGTGEIIDVRMYCFFRDVLLLWNYIPYDDDTGNWDPPLRCPYGQVVCGFRTMRAGYKKDCKSPIVHLDIVCCDKR